MSSAKQSMLMSVPASPGIAAIHEELPDSLAAAGLGVWRIDLRTGEVAWLPGTELLHGLPAGTPAVALRRYQDEIVHPEDRSRFGDATQLLHTKAEWLRLEYRVVWPDGTVHWLELRGRARMDSSGRPIVVTVFLSEIHERKQLELDLEFLARASARLAASNDDPGSTMRCLADLAVPDLADWCAVGLLQSDGSLKWEAAAHRDPEKLEFARRLYEQFPPDRNAPVGLWAAVREGKGILVEHFTDEMLANGAVDRTFARELSVRSLIAAPLIVRGRTLGVLALAMSESGRRFGRHELALAEDLGRRAAAVLAAGQLVERLRQEDRNKDVFLATLAHELRNPLAPIRNCLDILRRSDGDPQRLDYVEGVIDRQVGQLSRLVDDLLDISRIGRGKLELRKETTNLMHVLGMAVEMSRPHIEAAHHKLTLSFPDEPAELVGDPARLAQVFSNLLNNAARYTRHGGRIDVVAEAHADELVVRVRDNGIGIAPEALPRIFGLFEQGPREGREHQGGLGIGLALVEGLVRLHGGRIEAFSAGKGQGSEFTVHLPRSVRRHAEVKPPVARAVKKSMDQASRRVLIVEDSEDASESMAELLRMSGHEVRIAADGAAAVDLVRQFRPDVVFLDIGLPDLDGYEVARRIRQLSGVRQPALIALTGWGQQQDQQSAQMAGIDRHWTKPINPTQMLEFLAH